MPESKQDQEVQAILEEIRNAKTTMQATITELEMQRENLGRIELRLKRLLSTDARVNDLFK